MIFRSSSCILFARRRLFEALGLHMIQCAASGTLDLELGEIAHAGEKSFAVAASPFFQHMQKAFCAAGKRPFLSCANRNALILLG